MSFYHRRVVQPLCSLIERNPTRSFLFGLFWMGLAHFLKTLADVFDWSALNELAYVVLLCCAGVFAILLLTSPHIGPAQHRSTPRRSKPAVHSRRRKLSGREQDFEARGSRRQVNDNES